jgi:16S rRNA (cytosine967-C5)-methyltransferase
MEDAREAAYRFLSTPGKPAATQEGPASPLAAELGYGVLRHRSRLDWIIGQATDRSTDSLTPEVLTILRLGVYQILFTGSVPPYAAVSESVNLAGRHAPRAKGFVNWALRRIDPSWAERPGQADITDPVKRLATSFSFPAWMAGRWQKRFGEEETRRLMEAMNTFPPLDLRVNTLRSTPEEAARELSEAGGDVTRGAYATASLHLNGLRRVTELPAFLEGKIYIQDQSSQLAALALAPRPGETVLDACAGVGGKSSHLAEIMEDKGEITAVDPDAGRLRLLKENLHRLGITSVTAVQEDLLSPSFSPDRLFDRILVDAPCSGLGIIRRHPDLKWSKKESDVPRLASLQLKLLRRAASLLLPGGTLAYSTCTTEPEENQKVVETFLRKEDGFRAVSPPPGCIGKMEDLLTPEGYVLSLPHRHGMNGGFVALLLRSS